jgi:hypothetical protein
MMTFFNAAVQKIFVNFWAVHAPADIQFCLIYPCLMAVNNIIIYFILSNIFYDKLNGVIVIFVTNNVLLIGRRDKTLFKNLLLISKHVASNLYFIPHQVDFNFLLLMQN